MPKRSRKYEIGLAERLKDKAHAINYLNAAADDSGEAFLLALRDVAEAQKGMTRVSVDAQVNRENLYRMLSQEGNPRYLNFRSVLRALQLKFRVEDDTALNPSSRMPKQAKVGKKRSVHDPSNIFRLAFPFVAAGPLDSQLPVSGSGGVTFTVGPFTANTAAQIGGFSSESSTNLVGSSLDFYFRAVARDTQSATVNKTIYREVISPMDKKQQEKMQSLLVQQYGHQSAGGSHPVHALIDREIGGPS